jgi:hypothetical protein
MGPRGVSVLAGCMPVVGAGDRQVKSNSGACSGALLKGVYKWHCPKRGPVTGGQWAAAAPFIHSPAASVGSCTGRVGRTRRIDGAVSGLCFSCWPGPGSGQGWGVELRVQGLVVGKF